MANRIQASDVKAIMDNCTTDDSVVETFIGAAELVITQILGSDTTLTADQLVEIERWFTAHMIASTVFRTTSEEKVGDADFKYTGQWGKNLDSTPYGQMVKILDISGKMSNLGKMLATITAIESFTRKPIGDPYF
jgi:hypothetical protein